MPDFIDPDDMDPQLVAHLDDLHAQAKARGCTCTMVGFGIDHDSRSITLDHTDTDCPAMRHAATNAGFN